MRASKPAGQVARAGRDRADLDDAEPRRGVERRVPAVDWAGEAGERDELRRGLAAAHVAVGADHAAVDRHGHGRLGDRAVADRLGMDERLVAQVEQIVDEEAVVGGDVVIALGDRPRGVVEPVEVGDQVRIGARRVAQPDPHEAVALDGREDLDPRPAGDDRLARYGDARARGIEPQPMIAAFDDVAVEPAERQGDVAVRTAVGHRHRGAGHGPEQDHRPIDQRALEQRATDVRTIGRDLPAIGQEHRWSLVGIGVAVSP